MAMEGGAVGDIDVKLSVKHVLAGVGGLLFSLGLQRMALRGRRCAILRLKLKKRLLDVPLRS